MHFYLGQVLTLQKVGVTCMNMCLTIGGEEEARYDIGSSMESFPLVGLALQVEVLTMTASIPGSKVRVECWNSGTDAQLEAVVATSKSARLRETLPTASWVLDLYENPVTRKFDS
jgi:hypothetical protein